MLMHKNKKAIVVIGAGSASFGLSTLGAILRKPELKGSDLRLIDINEDGLNTITKLAEKANKEWSAGFTIKSSTSRDELLKGANFIIHNSERNKTSEDFGLIFAYEDFGDIVNTSAIMECIDGIFELSDLLIEFEE